MRKGLMRLNDAELNWLGGSLEVGGRITGIDLQKGCPWQCITCGIDAPKKSKNMPWSDYMTISDSIAKIYINKGVDILSDDRIDPFDSSDPVYYHSWDGKAEKTIYHVLKDLTERHFRDTALTTTGWRSGNNYMQRTMEDIVREYPSKSPRALICYSFKASPLSLIREYDRFIEENKRRKIHPEDMDIEFMKSSKHVSMMIQNLKTLAPIASYKTVGYDIQCLKTEDTERLNADNNRYSSLLSLRFIKYLEIHLWEQINSDTTIKQTRNPYTKTRSGRYFAGLGRMLNLGHISQSEKFEENNSKIKSNSPHKVDDNDYFVKIDCEGIIEIYYGPRHGLSSILVPKEHFQIMAQQVTNKDKKEEYNMLAELQGKNILRY